MPPWSSLQLPVPVTTAMGPTGGGPGVGDTWPVGRDGIVCPAQASAGGRCVCGTLGFHKIFLLMVDTIMGLSADNNPGGQSGQDSIICLVHRLGMGRPAEQAVLVPGPALSDPADKLSGAGPMARSCRPVQTPRPFGSLESMGSSIPPLLANNCSRPHPVLGGAGPDMTMLMR